MMYTMPKNLLSICVNFTLATQQIFLKFSRAALPPDGAALRRGARQSR